MSTCRRRELPGNMLQRSIRGKLTSGGLIEVDVDALKLEVRVSVVGAGGVDSVLIGNDFPENQIGAVVRESSRE